MTAQWLIEGPNLVFVLPLVLALVYLGLYVASGVTFGDPDLSADVDGDVNAHTDLDGHGQVDVDVDADHDIHHPHGVTHDLGYRDADGEASSNANVAFNVLSWFGVGRVPVSLWLSGAMLGWGAFGIGAAALMKERATEPSLAITLALAIATIGGLATTRMLTIIVTRIVPIHETYARRKHELLGSVGEAIYPIDASFGMAGIRDERGELFQVGCRVEDGVGPIAKGTRVKLIGYNRDTKLYHVVTAE